MKGLECKKDCVGFGNIKSFGKECLVCKRNSLFKDNYKSKNCITPSGRVDGNNRAFWYWPHELTLSRRFIIHHSGPHNNEIKNLKIATRRKSGK